MNKSWTRIQFLKTLPVNAITAEIGVWRGAFSKKILSVTKPKKLFLIDPWIQYNSIEKREDEAYNEAFVEVIKKFKKQIKNGQVVLHRKKSHDAAIFFSDNFFDWIYIDGDHSYEAVIQDLILFFPKIKPGGVIFGDDYVKGCHGVVKAVNKFCSDYKISKTIIASQFVLRKDS